MRRFHCVMMENLYYIVAVEFPAVLLDMSCGRVASEFHHYVGPTEYPVLSAFCKELTGISQVCVCVCVYVCMYTALIASISQKLTLISAWPKLKQPNFNTHISIQGLIAHDQCRLKLTMESPSQPASTSSSNGFASSERKWVWF